MTHGKHAANIAAFAFPTPEEIAVLSVATVIIAGIMTAIIWGVDLGLTAGISLM